jgi:hypothetical protein
MEIWGFARETPPPKRKEEPFGSSPRLRNLPFLPFLVGEGTRGFCSLTLIRGFLSSC